MHDTANASDLGRRHYRERLKAALLPIFHVDPRLAEVIRDSWMERVAIVEAEGIDLP